MERETVCAYLAAQGCITAKLISGPNGNFVSGLRVNGERITLPVGKKSQTANLNELTILHADDGGIIATANVYQELDSVTL